MQNLDAQALRGNVSRLKEHIKMETLIPKEFYKSYYKDTGRPRGNKLESFIWFFVLKNLSGIADDTAFIWGLHNSYELRGFCEFVKVPAPSDITTFRERFGGYIELMFLNLVDITEPICRELDQKKSDYLLYDTTGVLANVKENNPKFFNVKLNAAKALAKKNPEYDPYKGVYSLLPETAAANPFVKQQYINGHFCYAQNMLKKQVFYIMVLVLFGISRFLTSVSRVSTPKSYRKRLITLTLTKKSVILPLSNPYCPIFTRLTLISNTTKLSSEIPLSTSMIYIQCYATIFIFTECVFPSIPVTPALLILISMITVLLSVPLIKLLSFFTAFPAVKTARNVSSSFVINLSKFQNQASAFVLAKLLALPPLTADASILTLTKIFVFIPVFPAVLTIGTISIVIALSPNALLISSNVISVLLYTDLFLLSLPKPIFFLLAFLN